jgi:hypothetical protein
VIGLAGGLALCLVWMEQMTGALKVVRLAYILARTREDVGNDLDTLAVAWTVRF